MKKFKLKNVIIAITLLLVSILFLPFPKHINKTLEGYKITRESGEKDENGNIIKTAKLNIIDDVEINVKGWNFYYLFKNDTTKIAYTIKNSDGSLMSFYLDSNGFAGDALYNTYGVFLDATSYYNPEINKLEFFTVQFTKDYNSVSLLNIEPDGISYIAPKIALQEGSIHDLLTSDFYD